MLVLLVEDNRVLAANIIEYLEAYGFECDYADNGNLGLTLAREQRFDVILLDIMLPGMDGINLCSAIRDHGISTPIIMMTAKGTLEDKLEGFDVGANDYLVKPFQLPELVARLKVLSSYQQSYHQNTGYPQKGNTQLSVGDLTMDTAEYKVNRAGQEIVLSKAGWQILELLIKASPNVVTKSEIQRVLWPDELPNSDALKSHIYQLRQQVDKPFSSALISTVRGVGLVLKKSESKKSDIKDIALKEPAVKGKL
ncbi:DNA-binding response regulator [Psychrosphaera saromensis]|uniref:Two-component system response regulator n=1 Tax=Psychrosphaera saromensis TaxID=716813 RepID=A0A2S7UX23_9GAMM|nr:response regulator transcription factor [Psychrosphaera saromensis]PQJ54536.1 two-component system response regulator [Psychrosphaera saromensis]GHB59139.1 DNA-binding response regulator [Psychrosphaera saromensis]GLQ14256.1 DNA-binding response regulator [Psychrosphaera saromensis]